MELLIAAGRVYLLCVMSIFKSLARKNNQTAYLGVLFVILVVFMLGAIHFIGSFSHR